MNACEIATIDEQEKMGNFEKNYDEVLNYSKDNNTIENNNGNEGGDTEEKPKENILEKITGYEEKNTEAEDKNGNKITIPAGFKVVNPNDDVTTGIIIEDVSGENEESIGNQYVWVPVGSIKYEDSKTQEIELARYTFRSSRVRG